MPDVHGVDRGSGSPKDRGDDAGFDGRRERDELAAAMNPAVLVAEHPAARGHVVGEDTEPIGASPGRLRRSRRACTTLQRSGEEARTAPLRAIRRPLRARRRALRTSRRSGQCRTGAIQRRGVPSARHPATPSGVALHARLACTHRKAGRAGPVARPLSALCGSHPVRTVAVGVALDEGPVAIV
jgi:hypothetical protein